MASLEDLTRLLTQRWRLDARCLDADPEAFFPDKGGTTAPALALCDACPVAESCREYAIEEGEQWGIWGGMTARQRRRERRIRGLADGLATGFALDPWTAERRREAS